VTRRDLAEARERVVAGRAPVKRLEEKLRLKAFSGTVMTWPFPLQGTTEKACNCLTSLIGQEAVISIKYGSIRRSEF
jgi:hypothetical protein